MFIYQRISFTGEIYNMPVFWEYKYKAETGGLWCEKDERGILYYVEFVYYFLF